MASIQERLQTLIDEGRMLRRSLEQMSGAMEFPLRKRQRRPQPIVRPSKTRNKPDAD